MYKYMDNYVIIHMTVNINDKDEDFLYTFNQRSFRPMPDNYRPYLSHIRAMESRAYNKKYQVLKLDGPKGVAPSTQAVEKYVSNRISNEYKTGGYIYVPNVKRGFKIRKTTISGVTKTNNQKILYGSESSLNKLIKKEIGEYFFQNLKPEQSIYIANVRFFVDHKTRSLHDKFNEFCLTNNDNFKNSLRNFSFKQMTGAGRVRRSKNKTRKRSRKRKNKRH